VSQIYDEALISHIVASNDTQNDTKIAK